MPDTSSPAAVTALAPLAAQAERLIELGVHDLAGTAADELRPRAAPPVLCGIRPRSAKEKCRSTYSECHGTVALMDIPYHHR
ncbi:hypothetical protein [Streptomyces sp. NPDC056628]|uniref:hypothetical protein n=1 Tax=Streptomyces sp. NPDC056628 TaxID=3345882 RepID=UPI0036BECD21